MTSAVLVGAFHDVTEAMGPGRRACLWVAGCSLNCRGCATPEFIGTERGFRRSVTELCEQIDAAVLRHGIQGVTFSGGEPFEQAPALAEIALHARIRGLSVLSFSGYVRKFLAGPRAPQGAASLLAALDVLIDGPFLDRRVNGDPMRGSSNQVMHFLTARYGEKDFAARRVEVRLPLVAGGDPVINGVADTRGIKAMLRLMGV